MSYTFLFVSAEAVNNMCGLGFNGYDENGKAKWNRMTNVDILKLEVCVFLCMYVGVMCFFVKSSDFILSVTILQCLCVVSRSLQQT